MAPRSFWNGYLKLSLVTCPVAMVPALTEREKVRFHTLNRATGHRIQSQYVDAETGTPVDSDDQVKGYPTGEDTYITFEEEELESIGLESTRTIDLETFLPRDQVEWIWCDRPHYLMPDDPVGEEAFSVIREAMAATDMVAISRLVLYRREHAVMLEPRDRGIVLWTLRYREEVRDPTPYFGNLKIETVDPDLLSLAKKLIEERQKEWSPAMVRDPVQERLREMIAAKKKGRPMPKAKPVPAPAGNVISIMDALRKSIEEESRSGRGGRNRPSTRH